MAHIRLHRDLPYPHSAVYDVIADVVRYPQFMPGFKAVRTEGWEGDALKVRQTVGTGGLTLTFLSRATFAQNERIHIVSHERPFRVLRQTWRFEPTARGRTRLHLEAEYALADRLAGIVFERAFPRLLSSGLAAVGRQTAAQQRGRRDPWPPL